ncbi:MAG: hypothetical protein KA116_03410 [Proteobacteria bacterium]|nr:hypothetical protein [Pseudomonadota bacterium]
MRLRLVLFFLMTFSFTNLWAVDALLSESTTLRDKPDAAVGGTAVEGNQKVEALKKSKDGNWIYIRTDLANEGWVERNLLKRVSSPSSKTKVTDNSKPELPEIDSKVLAYRGSRLYEGPNTKNPKEVGEVEPDDELQILGNSPDGRWLNVKVIYTGIKGWVPASVATAAKSSARGKKKAKNNSTLDEDNEASGNEEDFEGTVSSGSNHDRLYTLGLNSHFIASKVSGASKNTYDKLISASFGKNFGVFEIVPRFSWIPGTSTNVIELGCELDFNFTKNKSPEKKIFGVYGLPLITKGFGDYSYTAYGVEGGFTSKYFILRKSSTAIRIDILARFQKVSSVNTISFGVGAGIQPYF